MGRRSRQIWIPILLVLIAANTAYLVAIDDPTLLRVASGLIHLLLGLLVCGLLLVAFKTDRRRATNLSFSVAGTATLAIITGLLLVIFGNLRPQYPLLVFHALIASTGVIIALAWVLKRARRNLHRIVAKAAVGITALAALAAAGFVGFHQPSSYSIENPLMAPVNMEEESFGGRNGMFFPSSAFTQDADTIPAAFFSRSESCGRSGCHPDAVKQWQSSAHHFSSFNNQWYRKSIEYMQDVKGLEAPKFCAGCHDHALLFSGQMAKPVSELLQLPESDAGTGCISCHSVASITGTMGNGGIEIAYPLLHEIATSDNRFVQIVHDFALRIDPEPHRRAFLKPLHRRQLPEFCSSCHKVHLDEPVNNYRWVRGFNTYDNWQASGVSGYGARSFYQPDVPQDCGSCHMPLVASEDAGNKNGFIHSHRFVAANTALPTANRDAQQLKATVDFLKADRLSVDVFAVSTTSADGDSNQIVAPLHPGMTALKRGSSVRLDVVVRSLSVGHFFPSGTVDAQEAWLELKVLDEDGEVIFWSGRVADNGRGPVDEGAHFYRSVQVDARSNLINKRNAWATRSTVYTNLIPPGSADVAHYRIRVPSMTTASLRIIASLHYRKFNWWHNHFAYEGVLDPDSPESEVSEDFDDRNWVFTGSTEGVSGELKSVPDLPIVTMATDTLRLRVGSDLDSGNLVTERSDYLRWNDYGIGLLRQGDLKAAERAFGRVTEINPSYADGWVNLARAYFQEGDLARASVAVSEAEAVSPGFYKARYFRALIAKAQGNYELAIEELTGVARRFPFDRVVRGELGRVYYLAGNTQDAAEAFERVLKIDPEDVGAHYNLMLIQRELGNEELARAHELRYARFKDDEAAPAVSHAYRQMNSFDNNESLSVHEHADGSSKR